MPSRPGERRKRIQALKEFTHTWIAYESPHRIVDLLEDMAAILGPERRLVLARELTKKFETVLAGTLSELQQALHSDPNQRRGEFVVLVEGASASEADDGPLPEAVTRTLTPLLETLPARQACQLISQLTGLKSRRLYKAAMQIKQQAAAAGD